MRIEDRIGDILAAQPRCADPWIDPIHAVDTALGIPTARTKRIVHRMLVHGKVELRQIVRNVAEDPTNTFRDRHWWVKG